MCRNIALTVWTLTASIGITPACAGTLLKVTSIQKQKEDHPCVCRNIAVLALLHFLFLGSPLRVQKHWNIFELFGFYWGITPACAGTFTLFSLHFCLGGDHPCVCRNIYIIFPAFLFRWGSPLRVQEHLNTSLMLSPNAGITPACAGTFTHDRRSLVFSQDHPCVCRNIL